ncbi:MAG: recombinase family protein [Clostridiales bacterium]|nr:recombinase family protein [Clostridiales bacterium]
MNDLKEKKIQCVVCYRLDRISRSVVDFALLTEKLEKTGASFISIREQFDTSTPMGRAMLYMASVFAQLERETIAERVRDNMLELAKKGRWLGGTPPYGFQSMKKEEIIIEGRKCQCVSLVWRLHGRAEIENLYRYFLKVKDVTETWRYSKRENMKNFKGEYYTREGIRTILKNPVYCCADQWAWDYFCETGQEVCFMPTAGLGLIAYAKKSRKGKRKWIIALGCHEGAVSGKEWSQAQKYLKTISSDFLSGKVLCGICKKTMYQRRRKENGWDYICSTKRKKGKKACASKDFTWKEEELVYIVLLRVLGLEEKMLTSDQKKLLTLLIEKIAVYPDRLECYFFCPWESPVFRH